jgi:hypothetical protein
MPFVIQTVSSISSDDGRGNIYSNTYTYSGGLYDYDYADREFRGFQDVTAYQMRDSQSYESKTETSFHQGYYTKGKIETQTQTSWEGHTREVENTWSEVTVYGEAKFPSLAQTTSTITDVGAGGPYTYTHRTTYFYDSYLNVSEEHKSGATSAEEIHTYFT